MDGFLPPRSEFFAPAPSSPGDRPVEQSFRCLETSQYKSHFVAGTSNTETLQKKGCERKNKSDRTVVLWSLAGLGHARHRLKRCTCGVDVGLAVRVQVPKHVMFPRNSGSVSCFYFFLMKNMPVSWCSNTSCVLMVSWARFWMFVP